MAYICAVRLNRTVGWKAFAEKSRGGMNRRGLSCHKGCNCGTKQDVSSCRKQHSNRAMRSIKDESDVRFKTGVENSVIAVVAAAFAVTMCIGFPGFACGAGQKEIVGQARVVDGDTLVIEEQRIRLYAIDAPETKQVCINDQREYNCGVISKSALEKRIDDRPVTCEAKKSLDKYGRQVAVCYVRENPSAEWEDLNAWMVKQGYAIAYRRYGSQYNSLEDDARAHKRGLWQGSFEEPEVWRQNHRKNSNRTGEKHRAE